MERVVSEMVMLKKAIQNRAGVFPQCTLQQQSKLLYRNIPKTFTRMSDAE